MQGVALGNHDDGAAKRHGHAQADGWHLSRSSNSHTAGSSSADHRIEGDQQGRRARQAGTAAPQEQAGIASNTPTKPPKAIPIQHFVLQFLSCVKPPLWYIDGSNTSSASTKRKLAAASGGMAWATMRPAGQEAPPQ